MLKITHQVCTLNFLRCTKVVGFNFIHVGWFILTAINSENRSEGSKNMKFQLPVRFFRAELAVSFGECISDWHITRPKLFFLQYLYIPLQWFGRFPAPTKPGNNLFTLRIKGSTYSFSQQVHKKRKKHLRLLTYWSSQNKKSPKKTMQAFEERCKILLAPNKNYATQRIWPFSTRPSPLWVWASPCCW